MSISAEALMVAGEAVKPGVSTKEIDKIAYDLIKKRGATPNFLGLYDFPATACISINNEVIHGIPKANRIIQEGDIVSIDLGAEKMDITAIMLLHLWLGLALPKQSG